MLYNGTLGNGISKEREVAIKKLDKIRSARQLEDEKASILRSDNERMEKKIKRYRALVQEQIDMVAAKKRNDGEIETARGGSSLGKQVQEY